MATLSRYCLLIVLAFGLQSGELAPSVLAAALPTSTVSENKVENKTERPFLSYIAPPPGENSYAQRLDTETYLATRKLKGTPRWNLAYKDSKLHTEELLETFSCASHLQFKKITYPAVFSLFDLISHTVKTYVNQDKNLWQRKRPFVLYQDQPFCTEEKRDSLGKTYSYPSGHTSLGWSFALALSELIPQHSAEILARGRQYGESRIICGAHWRSDVEAGFLEGGGIMSLLQNNPQFQEKLAAARKEIVQNHLSFTPQALNQCHQDAAILKPSPLDE